MAYGYNSKILRVNLTNKQMSIEEPDENFYRRYMGGRGFIAYYLLKELQAGIDPLGPDNKLIFATGVITGGRIAGSGRNSVGAKSPLTNGYGEAEAGGYWGPELKRAGYDAIIFEGKAEKPVYLWLGSGEPELRDASHLWGKTTLETETAIREELGDRNIKTALIGPAGENQVRVACILNDISHAYGRSGMGAVMGSKNLKGVAVRGKNPPAIADQAKIKEIVMWLSQNYSKGMQDLGTAGGLMGLNQGGGLPTRNFREGVFEGAESISGQTMRDTILINRGTCYACPVKCKRVVKVDEPYKVNPEYGGPEYETLGSLGSNCGVDNLAAIAKGNELCNAYGLDTIGVGTIIGFAMECFENGLITETDTDGIQLRFGNADAMVKMVEMIAKRQPNFCKKVNQKRQGIGDLLAEGVKRAAEKIGEGASEFAMHVKGQEFPMHEPRYKQGMGLGYAVSPTGADHMQGLHDAGSRDLGTDKVRTFLYRQFWSSFRNCAGICVFLPYTRNQFPDIIRGLTGWDVTDWELMKVGERCLTMTRAFNVREGFTKADDIFPKRIHQAFTSGPLAEVGYGEDRLSEAVSMYYDMAGWGRETGVPRKGKLQELDIEWVADLL
ncbi:aldehyde ferredoxin oxidoreductase family protein [Candidatus Poribacteria bacterium]|nr:aldehyde ferredoxin oxidoreductase family protein [Candidatus Poribacteria bacterium]